jgi:beta-lactamase regulating signal transducer with metallopeptidase domain
MLAFEILWPWLIRTAVFSSLILIVGFVAMSCVRQPAERLRLMRWVLAACLIIPWLPESSDWRTVCLDLDDWSSSSDETALTQTSSSVAMVPTAVSADALNPHEPLTSAVESPRETMDSSSTQRATQSATLTLSASAIESQHRIATSSMGFREMIVLAWLMSMSIMALWILAGLWVRFSLQRRAYAASPGLQRIFEDIAGPAGKNLRLIVSEVIDSPVTWGTRRPVIIVPKDFEENATVAEQRWGLAHEWSHVKRRDMASLWLALAVQFVCFYQPLYWVLRRRMILCQDYIADAFAAQHSDSAEDYAAFLIRLSKSRLQRANSLALGLGDYKSQLFQRISMLVDSQADIRSECRKRFTVLTACGSLICLLFLTTIQLDAANEPASSNASVSTTPTPREEELSESKTVTGVLIDAATGRPVTGAQVLLRGDRLEKTTSDESGSFRFEQVAARREGYDLLAYRENLVTGKILVLQLPNDDQEIVRFTPLRLEMKPGKQARFIVTSSETGKPIKDAAVRFGYPDRRSALTNEDGSLTVSGLIPQQYDVTIEAQGHARSTPQIDLNQADDLPEFHVKLVPGGEVQGVVVDEEGRPVSEAEVVYREPGATGYHGDTYRTNAEGKFLHRFLPLGVPIEVSIDKEDYVHTKLDVSMTQTVRTREVSITLPRRPLRGSVAGVVQDQDGKPVANVNVANYGNRDSQKRQTTTDVHGRFILHDLFEGISGYQIQVFAKGYSPQQFPVDPGSADTPTEITVTIESGHTVHGRVVSESGEAVSGAYVLARSSAFRWGVGGFESTRSNSNGEFTFDSLPSDVQFQVQHPEFAMTENMTLPLDGDESVTVTLPDPGVIKGRVLDEQTKRPIPQFRIRLGFIRTGHQPGDARGTYNGDWGNPGLTVKSDEGRFTIQPLMARMPLELIIEADGYDRLVVPRAVADKAKDAKDFAISLRPQATAEPHSLNVQFLDDAGKPIPSVQLRLIVSKDQPTGRDDNRFNWVLIESGQLGQESYVDQFLTGVTDADGKCAFTKIHPGKYIQLAYWGKGVPKQRSLAFDETRSGKSDNVVIDIPAPAIVRGSVDRSQFPEAGSIRISDPSEGFLDFEVKLKDDQSIFELRDLPSGNFTISVASKPVPYIENGSQYARITSLVSAQIVLEPGEITKVDFVTPDSPR